MSSMTEDWSTAAYGPKTWAGTKQIKQNKTNKQNLNISLNKNHKRMHGQLQPTKLHEKTKVKIQNKKCI